MNDNSEKENDKDFREPMSRTRKKTDVMGAITAAVSVAKKVLETNFSVTTAWR